MRRVISLTGMLCLIMLGTFYSTHAQNITRAEYFLDVDPGLNNGTAININPGTDITASFQVPVNLLTTGFHYLYVRSYASPFTVPSDSIHPLKGGWSLTSVRSFYKQDVSISQTLPNIIRGEYFFDTDPGFNQAINIPIAAATELTNVSFTADITSLPEGFHYMFSRFMDANGRWSLSSNRSFYKQVISLIDTSKLAIVAGEYFIDTDPGFNNGTAISLSPGPDLNNVSFAVEVNQVPAGFHMLSARFKDASGKWSLNSARSFYKQELTIPGSQTPAIVKIEQFLDVDPGFGNATNVPFTPGNDVTINFLVDLANQPIGNHRLYVRALDANGKWSIVNNTAINICTPAVITATQINQTACNRNDGAINLNVTGGTGTLKYKWSTGDTTKNLSGLAPGTYTVTVTDAQPCPATLTITILPAINISLRIDSVNTTCGNNNGSASVTILSGGKSPYTYLWSNGETAPAVSGLVAGQYVITVTDSNTCSVQREVTIGSSTPAPKPILTVVHPTDPCSAAATTITSTAAASYLWSTGATTQSISVTSSGSYSVITTTNGCTASDSATVIISNGNKTTLTYSGAPGYINSVVSPGSGVPSDTYRFEVKYINSAGIKPSSNFPQVLLDYEGNGASSGQNDLAFTMLEKDTSDKNVVDGKDYYYIVQSLPESRNYSSQIVVSDQGGCSTSFGPFAGPLVLSTADLSIFANDISFSNPKPGVNSNITVTATIHNNTGNDADNFIVHLVNQYDPAAIYPDVIVPHLSALPGSNTIQVSWNIVTPAVPAWCPMQVFVDYTNVLAEPNELDNQAIRPFVNGNFELPGDIAITAQVSDSTAIAGLPISISGKAYYRNTAVQLGDSSCAGATITATVRETGQKYFTNSNAFGTYVLTFNSPNSPGLYHVSLEITDYTLEGDTTTTFKVVNPEPCDLPNLIAEFALVPGSSNNTEIAEIAILAGDSIGGTLIIKNVGQSPAASTSVAHLTIPGASIVPGPYTVPTLAPGESFSLALPVMIFSEPSTTSLRVFVDYNNSIAECDENNVFSKSILVLPLKPDIVAYNMQRMTANQCAINTVSFNLQNAGGIATGPFNAHLTVRVGNTVMAVLDTIVSSIPARKPGGVVFAYKPPVPGVYTYSLSCDFPDAVDELSEMNNTATAEIEVVSCLPDLTVYGCSFLDVKPMDPAKGDSITISAVVANSGLASTNQPFRVSVNAGGQVYYITVPDILTPGSTRQISVRIPRPVSGNDTLLVSADSDSVIPESSEGNNTASNLLCSDFELTNTDCARNQFIKSTQVTGSLFTLATGLKNLGSYEASSAQVKFEVSGPGIDGWKDLGFVSTFIDNTCGCPLLVKLPGQFQFTQTGNFIIRVTADFGNLYEECKESNNVLEIKIQVDTTRNLPDYKMLSQFIAPSLLNPDVDQPVKIDISYLNQGTTSVDSLELFVQVDNTPLDSVRVRGLDQNKTNTDSLRTQWSSSVRGVHVIRAVVDNNLEVPENDEENNEATRAIVVGKAPNLRFSSFNVSDTSARIGSTVSISAIIVNDGLLNCLTTYSLYYVDNNNAEVLIARRTVALDSLGSRVVTIPWTVLDPTTTIIARITNTTPDEYDLLDNETSRQTGIMILSTFSTSSSCSSGKDGIAGVRISGGTPPYQVLWDSGETGDSIRTGPGWHLMNVTDAEGNLKSDSVFVTSRPDPVIRLTSTPASSGNNGTATVAVTAGGEFTVMWNDDAAQTTTTAINLAAGTYIVKVNFGSGCTFSDSVRVGTTTNRLPVITITSPSNGASYSPGVDITATASASDPDGSISRVQFFYIYNSITTQLADSLLPPYQYIARQVESGVYPIFFKATDNQGGVTYSDTILVNVTSCIGSGSIAGYGYTNVPGSQLSDLLAYSRYPDSPNVFTQFGKFEYGPEEGENYGGRLRGYICAPVTGDYTFYISSNGQSELWFSRDDNPANKAKIASVITPTGFRQWLSGSTQQSASIRLVKGVRYYVETIHKAGTGQDHLSVGWLLPDGNAEGPIPGTRLSPYFQGGTQTTRLTRGFQEAIAAKSAGDNDHFTVKAVPNPTENYFTLITNSSSSKVFTITITDIAGRVIERRSNIPAESKVIFGSNYTTGTYFAEVVQGTKRTLLKLIKL